MRKTLGMMVLSVAVATSALGEVGIRWEVASVNGKLYGPFRAERHTAAKYCQARPGCVVTPLLAPERSVKAKKTTK